MSTVVANSTANNALLPGDSLSIWLLDLLKADSSTLPVLITQDVHQAELLAAQLRAFSPDLDIMIFPDWEILAYDRLSPHPEIISNRLEVLAKLPLLKQGLVILPIPSLVQRLAPKSYIDANRFVLKVGETIDRENWRLALENVGYRAVSQVTMQGEFAIRGSVMDIFPMGYKAPIRIDCFDDEIESIQTFDVESQRSDTSLDEVKGMPAREYPQTEEAIRRFRSAFREYFSDRNVALGHERHTGTNGNGIYQQISDGLFPGGTEFYLPLFFDETACILDYLPKDATIVHIDAFEARLTDWHNETHNRYEQCKHDRLKPPMEVNDLFWSSDDIKKRMSTFKSCHISTEKTDKNNYINLPKLPEKHQNHLDKAALFYEKSAENAAIIWTSQSLGRADKLKSRLVQSTSVTTVNAATLFDTKLAPGHYLLHAPIQRGFRLKAHDASYLFVAEADWSDHVTTSTARKKTNRDAVSTLQIQQLLEMSVDTPIVHSDYGIGRYQGLITLTHGPFPQEFLQINYAAGDKLFVPVHDLALITRYAGPDVDGAPLHKLGGEQWKKAREKAFKQVRDVAAELLDLQAKRALATITPNTIDRADYDVFCDEFPFDETPDQAEAILAVEQDLTDSKPMDRVVCGDVGFGKTEVAMRAAFIAASSGKQVAILVPTTLLAEQHYQTISDRFANWPLKIGILSRFHTPKTQAKTREEVKSHQIDIVIGTQKLLSKQVEFADLGLLIIDEEHRFGVRQKEALKKRRAEVNILALTATPIPRTMNMAMGGMRDLSIIATPPAKRLSINTTVHEQNNQIIEEAIRRELARGGQIFFLHNKVETIEKRARDLQKIVPNVSIEVAHGQMREKDLEAVMRRFYQGAFQVLVCTTIIETGIDIPNANTMIMDRADLLGLAQLHQLRGRVGRSHHQAYAYLLTPNRKVMTNDAIKRLEAIDTHEDLGAGFMLASQDLEIRGAGELLGDSQSGQMQSVGFNLYLDLLERTTDALKKGDMPNIHDCFDPTLEMNLRIQALIPETYIHDTALRLSLYKRIGEAATDEALDALQVEMIDRFGLLPDPLKHFFRMTSIRRLASSLPIDRIDLFKHDGKITFKPLDSEKRRPILDSLITLVHQNPRAYGLKPPSILLIKDVPEAANERFEIVEKIVNHLKQRV